MARQLISWVCVAVGLALLAAAAVAQPAFPELSGRVVDEAGLLSSDDRRQLVNDLAALEAKSTDRLVVVTLQSLQGYEIEEFGYRLGRHWGIGQAGKDNGVLLIVAPSERKVRIEVGRGLEPLLTDGLTKIIIENAILPKFRGGDFAAGILAGARDITAVLLGDAEEVKARAVTASDDQDDLFDFIFIVIWLAIVIIVIWTMVESACSGKKGTRRGGWISDSGGSRRSGGGFSGGGGGFGGGGSSGSW